MQELEQEEYEWGDGWQEDAEEEEYGDEAVDEETTRFEMNLH